MSLFSDLRSRFRRNRDRTVPDSRAAAAPLPGSQAAGLLEEIPGSRNGHCDRSAQTSSSAVNGTGPSRLVEPKPLTPAEELVRLVRHVDAHLEAQAGRTERLTEALVQIPDRLASLPELSRAHSRLLEALGDHRESAERRQERVVELLGHLGDHATRQTDTVELLAQHMEAAEARRDLDRDAAAALRRTLEGLASAQTSAGESIAAAGRATAQREAALVASFERMHTWLVAAVVIAGLSAVGAAVLAGIVLSRW